MTALAGWERVPAIGDPPARVGLYETGGAETLVAARLERLGSEVVAIDLPNFARAREMHRLIQSVEAAAVHDGELADAAAYFGDEVRERLRRRTAQPCTRCSARST